MRTHDAVRGIRWSSLLLCALLAGCGGAKGDLEKWVAEVKARPAPPLDPLPVMQQFETFEYAAQNLRDPFSEAFSGAAGSGPRPDPGRAKQTLEQFPLDSLDMVGTIGEGAEMIALIMDPDHVVHQVSPGQYMGQSDGRITGIHEDRIDLTELVPDGAGGWMERQAQVALDDE